MSQELRLILAIGLSVLVFYVYQTHFAPPPPEPKDTQVQQANDDTKTKEPVQQTQTLSSDQQEKTAQTLVDMDAKTEGEVEAKEQDIVVETPVSKIVIATKGAVLTGYELKEFKLEAKADSPNKDLLAETNDSSALFLGLKGYSQLTPNRVYRLVKDVKTEGLRQIVLEWYNDKVRVEKIFNFDFTQKDYAVTVSYNIENRSQMDLVLTPYLENTLLQKEMPKEAGGILSFLKFQRPDVYGLFYLKGKDLTSEENWKNFQGNMSAMGDVHWSGIADRYFLLAMLYDSKENAVTTTSFDRKNEQIINKFYNGETTLAPQGKMSGQFLAYIGPKQREKLGLVSPYLKRAVDYGWFSILAIPILWFMTFLHKIIPSWGVVIIALTFIVKLLLHPFNKKSMTSMKAMQQLQPKMKKIKEKYADDKQKQNEEVMQLFKTHKVNPMGGCLPMLLQFPVYIALYKVLWNAIELYHVPFMMYADLSAPDPYFVSPVLLGVFMFLQQKLTPTASTDPAQQKMMMFMPIMFTVFLLFLPVGLVIYIFVNTFMSVIQQYMMKHDLTMKDLVKGKWRPQTPNP